MSVMSRPTTFRSRLRVRPVFGLLAAGLFLALLVGQSPHLVHHLFETGQIQTDCTFASTGERTQWIPAEIVTLIPTPVVEGAGCGADHSALPSPAPAPSDARAPPLLAS
jgi:hypothetical protein